MEAEKAKRALELATELDGVAKSIPVRVETLLDLIEPPIWDLRGMNPSEAAAHLRAMVALRRQRRIREAVVRLIRSKEDRDRIVKCRKEMIRSFDRISIDPLDKRQSDLELQANLETELKAIYSRWPTSRFVEGLVSNTIEDLFRRTLGDGRWLVPSLNDNEHREVRELLEVRYGFHPQAVSPLRAWLLCPRACRDCRYRLKDRMREAIELLPPDRIHQKEAAEILKLSSTTVGRWAKGERTPSWIDTKTLQLLLTKEGGRYLRGNIEELAKMKSDFGSQ